MHMRWKFVTRKKKKKKEREPKPGLIATSTSNKNNKVYRYTSDNWKLGEYVRWGGGIESDTKRNVSFLEVENTSLHNFLMV